MDELATLLYAGIRRASLRNRYDCCECLTPMGISLFSYHSTTAPPHYGAHINFLLLKHLSCRKIGPNSTQPQSSKPLNFLLATPLLAPEIKHRGIG